MGNLTKNDEKVCQTSHSQDGNFNISSASEDFVVEVISGLDGYSRGYTSNIIIKSSFHKTEDNIKKIVRVT